MLRSQVRSHLLKFLGVHVRLQFKSYRLEWKHRQHGDEHIFSCNPSHYQYLDDQPNEPVYGMLNIDEMLQDFQEIKTPNEAFEFFQKSNCMWPSYSQWDCRKPKQNCDSYGTVRYSDIAVLQGLFRKAATTPVSKWHNLSASNKIPYEWVDLLRLQPMLLLDATAKVPTFVVGSTLEQDPDLPLVIGTLLQIRAAIGCKYECCARPGCLGVLLKSKQGHIYCGSKCRSLVSTRRNRAKTLSRTNQRTSTD